jgi:hypothetical protein
MIKIEYPAYQPKIKEQLGKEFIFDEKAVDDAYS